MRWTGTDFEFDEEIDPEQEHRLNQSACRDFVPYPGRPSKTMDPPAGYACVYESWFTNCSLWWPLPEFLTTYCHRRRIALGQYTANGIRILVTLTVLAAELGISMSVRLFEEHTTPSITAKTWFFYGKMVPKYNVITGKPSKVNFWNRDYFYVKINDASFEYPSIVLNVYFNANIGMTPRSEFTALLLIHFICFLFGADRLSKWSQGGTGSFLEEVEAIRTLSHQHWPDISETRIQAALKRISRGNLFFNCALLIDIIVYADDMSVSDAATDSSPNRISRMGKINLASLPSHADTIGTPVHENDLPGSGRPTKRRRSATAEEEISRSSPTRSSEILVLSPAIPAITTEVPTCEHQASPQMVETRCEEPTKPVLAGGEEGIRYPHVMDFRYRHLSVSFVEDNEAPARLFRQIQLKRRGIPELE
ncbi:hypothetical protein N665_0019s0064 [Sinapis alba]|nr:hypothetical protein N665_0019s0064 [Sinapis alba]